MPETAPNADCAVCHGSGIDHIFRSKCSECYVDARREELLRAAYASNSAKREIDNLNELDNRYNGRRFDVPSEKQLKFIQTLIAERENTDIAATAQAALAAGMSKKQASNLISALLATNSTASATASTVRETTIAAPAPSEKQLKFASSLLAERGLSIDELATHSKSSLSKRIDELLSMPKKSVERVVLEETDIDLRPLERLTSRNVVRVGVPNSDSRLKLRIKFDDRRDVIFVDDAAEYGSGRSYGSQRSNAAYRGDCAEQLRAVLADPEAALARYAALTSNCGICNRKLEDEESVARGIGPICAQKL